MASANLGTFFILLIAMQACLFLYQGQEQTAIANNSLWDFVWNTQNWANTEWALAFVGIAGTLGLIEIASSAFGFKTDFIIFSVAILGFISMGVVFVNFWNVIGSDFASLFGCDSPTCTPVNWIRAVFLGPIAFYYVWTVVNWWRRADV